MYVENEEFGGLPQYGRILRQHKRALIFYALVCALAAFGLSKVQAPIYQASTSLEIQGVNENFLNISEKDPIERASNTPSESYIQTQIEILTSRALIGSVISKMKLEQRPEVVNAPGRLASFREAWGLSQPSLSRRERAMDVAKNNLKVSAVRGTRIVRIQWLSTDAKYAAEFVNTLAQEYVQQNLEFRLKSNQHTQEWLARQLEDLRMKLEQSEDQLQTYSTAADLMFTGEKDSVAEEKLKQIQEEFTKAEADRITKQSRYELVTQSPPDALPEVLDSGPLREYQVQLANLRQQSAELRSLLTPGHYKVKQIEAQINGLVPIVERERANVITRIRNDYDASKRRENLLSQAFVSQAQLVSAQGAKLINYKILKREVDTNRQLYDSMLQRVKEANINSAMRASNVVVIDPADPPFRPYKPEPVLNASLGLLTGFCFGMLFVFFQHRADRTLKLPGDSMLYLSLPELGVIPSGDSDPSLRPHRTRLLPGAIETVELATWQLSPSLLAESFRATLASILFTRSTPGVIVVTSPAPGEGKTTTVCNLGIALARIRKRVLVIDGDMRRPRLHTIFSLPDAFGLSDLLKHGYEISDRAAPQPTTIPGLYVLTSGSPDPSPSDLLHSPVLSDLLSRFRGEYDAVLIDTPPVLQLVDARVLSRAADAVVMICRSGVTDREQALAATQRLMADGIPVIGTILNDCDPQSAAHYQAPRYDAGRAETPIAS
jgi:polysaccharide biosynthesis transport protein